MKARNFVLLTLALALSSALAMAGNQTPRPLVVHGTISAIDAAAQPPTVTVQPPVNCETCQPVTFIVTPATVIYKNGRRVQLGDLALGDIASAALRPDGDKLVALKIEAKSPVQPIFVVRGKIIQVAYEARTFVLEVAMPAAPGPTTMSIMPPLPRTMLFVLAENGEVIKNGRPAQFANLAAGDLANVAYLAPPPSVPPGEQPLVARRVEAWTPEPPRPQQIRGTILEIQERTIILGRPEAAPLPIAVPEGVEIVKFYRPAPFAALSVGDLVHVVLAPVEPGTTPPPTAQEISVLPLVFEGNIVGVVADPALVSVKNGDVVKDFRVVEMTRIIKFDRPVLLRALAEGDRARVEFFVAGDGNIAATIHAAMPIPTPPAPPRQ